MCPRHARAPPDVRARSRARRPRPHIEVGHITRTTTQVVTQPRARRTARSPDDSPKPASSSGSRSSTTSCSRATATTARFASRARNSSARRRSGDHRDIPPRESSLLGVALVSACCFESPAKRRRPSEPGRLPARRFERALPSCSTLSGTAPRDAAGPVVDRTPGDPCVERTSTHCAPASSPAGRSTPSTAAISQMRARLACW